MNIPGEKELNSLRDECYNVARAHGFHDVKYSDRHFLCLVISELMEAVEADRRDKPRASVDYLKLQMEHAIDDDDFTHSFECFIKDTVEDELADTAIRILDLAGLKGENIGIRFWSAVYQHDENTVDYYRKNFSFTEVIYSIVSLLTYPARIGEAMYMLFVLAELMGFDLMEHIKLKIEYNKHRERLYGKKY